MKLQLLLQSLLLSSALVVFVTAPAKGNYVQKESFTSLPEKATLDEPVIAQSPAESVPLQEVVTITGVKANPTDKGVEVILETTKGDKLQVANRSTGNNFIADITGGQLRLPNGDAFTFKSEKPLSGIIEVTVTNIDANTVRVTVVGEKTLPTVELFDDNAGLIFAVAEAPVATQPPQTAPVEEKPVTEAPQEKPAAQQDDPIELVVTGEQDGYRAPNASTATRTDTPIRDIPQSIQVVPRQVLEDRRVRTVTEAVETVSGVVENFRYLGSTTGGRIIRGFPVFGSIRNGFREISSANPTVPIGTIEQVEVLKGPSSVVLGAVEPGGIINYVTRQPLSTPYYKLGLEVGNYGRYQPSIDLSGPLTADKNVLYRFIAGYERQDSFQKFANLEITTIAPSIAVKLGERTDINLYYEYSRYFTNPPVIEVPLLSDGSLPPRSLFPGYPFVNLADFDAHKFGYTFTHRFNDDWQIRNNLAVTIANNERRELQYPSELLDDRFLDGFQRFDFFVTDKYYVGQIDLLGKFKTGSISHQLLVGFDVNILDTNYTYLDPFGVPDGSLAVPRLDIRNPDYNAVRTRPEVFAYPAFVGTDRSYGFYLQDQIAFSDNLKLLIGGRYDWLSSKSGTVDVDPTSQNDGAFSPRIGLVYQPSKNVSLYTSYSQSFNPSIGRNPDNKPFEPTRGTQYEVGVKTDFLDGRLSATLAAYNITKTNVLTPDPDPVLAQRGFQVQVGEQLSRGIELDVTGEILPGWKIITSYAHTDATVTVDNSIPSTVGNRLANVPQNQASLWTTYEIQKGNLQGLGFGLGLFYIGERQGNLANLFQVGDYLRTDAAIYYRRNGFNAAINIRNLFDIDYASSVSFGNRFQVSRGEPFTIVGSVSWEF
ncbi:ferrichrome-iron receptor [Rivularia sp. IAM M-261]|nr:ferrichrome-iron receptor [Rivularia sp. IAM M-261]